MKKSKCPTCQDELPAGSICPKDGATVPFPMDEEKGFQAGDYFAEKKIGAGGMGEVWKGTHPKIKKQVAIKVLNKKLVDHQVTNIRFKREALAVNTIRSRYIVDIFATGELPDGRPYMVMEYLEGVPLSKYLKRGPLPFSEILEFCGQICKGLTAAHEKGIIHRDLKPDNVFLILETGEKPLIKLLDFGIAKILDHIDDEEHDLTTANVAFGTPTYMSPEQCKGAKEVDHRTDIYALGILLFQMITGRTPFREPNEGRMAVMIKQMTMAPPSLQSCVSGRFIPEGIEAFVAKALAKNPAERPASCAEFFTELESILKRAWSPALEEVQEAAPIYSTQGADTTGPSAISLRMSGVSAPPKKTAKPPRALFVAVALLLVVGAGVIYWFSLPPPALGDVVLPKTQPALASNPVSTSAPLLSPVSEPTSQRVVRVSISSKPDDFRVYELKGGQKIELGRTPFTQEAPAQEGKREFLLQRDGFEDLSLSISSYEDVSETLVGKRIVKTSTNPKPPVTEPTDGETADPFGVTKKTPKP